VFNILEHKSETERIIFEDEDAVNGFILVPDMKWDSRVVDNLYVLAIVHARNIRSLRDLNGDHVALLENVRDKCWQAIEAKFNVKKDKLRCYIHYQPSFYHLHVHFSHIKFQAGGMPERNHSLHNVIENIKIDPDYYKKATLEFIVKKNEKLYDLFKHKIE
jgi:m7GpppX diphosphatase